MNKKVILTLGVLSPVVYFIVAMALQLSIMFSIGRASSESDIFNAFSSRISVIYLLACILMIVILILKAYFIKHVLTNKMLTGNEPVVWFLLLLLLNTIPMFVYMYKYIYGQPWKECLSADNHKTGSRVIWTGIVALVPYLFVIGVLMSASAMFDNMMTMMEPGGMGDFILVMLPMIIMEVLMLLSMLAAMIVFIMALLKNDQVTGGLRTSWIVMMILQSTLAAAIYWYIFEFQEEEAINQNK